MFKFLKSSLSLILSFIILAQPCYALDLLPINNQLTNLTQLINPNTQMINYAYDALNRLDLKTYPNQSTVDYTYDLGSRLVSVQRLADSVQYGYDAVNRITSATNTVNSIPYTLDYQYDQLGNRSQLTYPSGTILNYTYDELNRLTDINNLGINYSYTYDILSRRTKLTMPNSAYTEYVYDNNNRLLTLRNRSPRYGYIPFAYKEEDNVNADKRELHANKRELGVCDHLRVICGNLHSEVLPSAYAEVPVIHHPFIGVFSLYNYTYDNADNRTSALHQIMDGQRTNYYNYDSVYQVTGVSGNQAHNYDYDPVGNREVADGTAYTTNNLNQYSQVGAITYQYDLNGNLTNDGVNTYTYDYENRLITALGNGHNSSYNYDGLGRRISKTVDGTTTYFIYDGDQIVEERNASNQLIASYIYGQGIDEILKMNRNNTDYYYHYDGLGSVSDITDLNGYVIENYSYDVYGLPSQLSMIGNRNYFTGREYDSEAELYYYRARYYNPAIGRFLQRDPLTWGPDDIRSFSYGSFDKEIAKVLIKSFSFENTKVEHLISLMQMIPALITYIGSGNTALLNLYSYCGNNPINWLDPRGFSKSKSDFENFMDRFHQSIGLDTSNKYFDDLYFWSSYLNYLAQNFQWFIVSAIGPQLVIPPPYGQIVAGGLVFSASTGFAIMAYKEAWKEYPY